MIRNAKPKRVIGLTGGVASGKSSVARIWEELGAAAIDTDVLAREQSAAGSMGLSEIVAEFGSEMLGEDGNLNRRRMRERVFADPTARQRLEAILHPRIHAAAQSALSASRAPLWILVVPLLVESGQYDWVDTIVVVDVPQQQQLARLEARDGVTPQLAAQMLAAQASRSQRLAQADAVIRNSGSLAQLRQQAVWLYRALLSSHGDARFTTTPG